MTLYAKTLYKATLGVFDIVTIFKNLGDNREKVLARKKKQMELL